MGGDDAGRRLGRVDTLNEGTTLTLEVLEEETAAVDALTIFDALEHEVEIWVDENIKLVGLHLKHNECWLHTREGDDFLCLFIFII